MTIKSIILSISVILLPIVANSQIVSYDDVAVVINDNSQTSIDIGNYFQQKRNIPNQNMIHITGPIYEEIDSLEFEQIRSQIENYLTINNLVDSFNYIVTTKGVPLKVARGNCSSPSLTTNCASFDSEIALILGSYSGDIAQPVPFTSLTNPYFNSNVSFSRSAFGLYLVTRLDGYTQGDVFNLIDRSGHATGINKLSAQAIIDVSHYSDQSVQATFINQYQSTNAYLVNNAWNVNFHTDTALSTDQSNVFGYSSTNGQPSGAVLNNSWTKGSFGSVFHSYSAGTFNILNNPTNALIVANLIKEGCTASHGYAYEAYSNYGLKTDILFDRYLDPINDYNLAESYYMADPLISCQTIVIGDPKASVIIDNSASLFENEYQQISIYPNPSSGSLTIDSKNIRAVYLYDMNGRLMFTSENKSDHLILDLNLVNPGVYMCTIITQEVIYHKRIVIRK